VARLIDAGVAVVCGTTGWEPDAALAAKARSATAPVVIAPNFSLGMNLFYRLVRDAACLVGGTRAYDPFISEAHHRGKRDAPSGTARRLAEIVRESDPSITEIHSGPAEGGVPEGTLQVASVRAGSIPGTHSVGWDGEFDAITLEHCARSRGVFAMGAIYAAEWILDAGATAGERTCGLHSFDALIERRIRDGRDGGA
jgi:4-hydroxy-tetrahydrodipicolinate reductase